MISDSWCGCACGWHRPVFVGPKLKFDGCEEFGRSGPMLRPRRDLGATRRDRTGDLLITNLTINL